MRYLLDGRIIRRLGFAEHVALDSIEQRRDSGANVSEVDGILRAGVSAHSQGLLLGKIIGSDFETKRNTLLIQYQHYLANLPVAIPSVPSR
jgi:hypothetical protein